MGARPLALSEGWLLSSSQGVRPLASSQGAGPWHQVRGLAPSLKSGGWLLASSEGWLLVSSHGGQAPSLK